MAWRKIDDTKLTAVADAVREQLATTNKIPLDDMPGMIRSIGIGVVPDYWKAHLAEKADAINAALDAAGENRSAFLWYTDAHITTNYGTSPVMLKYLSKHTGMRKTFFGGDAAVEKTGELDVLTAWLENVGEIPSHRSLIGNHDNNCTDFATVAAKAEFFLQTNRTEDMAFGDHATNGKMYYYVDSHQEKTRYICLSTGRMWTNADEVEWCIGALNSTPKNWHIVVLSHLWLNNDYDNGGVINTTPVDYTQGYLDMFDSYNYRLSGTESFTGRAYDFVNAEAKIEFIVGGHVHQDYDFTTTRGIPIILTECDSWQERDDVSVAKQGTTSESCVYAIVADYAANVVKVINVGRGDTRSLTIPKVSTYKNVLPTAKDWANMESVYNGIGYKPDTRISVSSGAWEDKTESGWCTSGLLPGNAGDIIRLANCKFPKTNPKSGTHRCSIYGAKADGTYSGYMVAMADLTKTGSACNPVYGPDGDNVIQFTVPSSLRSGGYFRIVVQEFTESSIVTVNEEID